MGKCPQIESAQGWKTNGLHVSAVLPRSRSGTKGKTKGPESKFIPNESIIPQTQSNQKSARGGNP